MFCTTVRNQLANYTLFVYRVYEYPVSEVTKHATNVLQQIDVQLCNMNAEKTGTFKVDAQQYLHNPLIGIYINNTYYSIIITLIYCIYCI